MGWSEAYDDARRHGGVLLVRDGPRFGLTPGQIRARGIRERWDRPYRGQVVVPGAVRSHQRRVWEALRSVGGEVSVTGRTALWLHGLVDRPPTQVHLLMDHQRRAIPVTGARRVQRTRNLEDHHLVTVDGVPTTIPARAIADVADEEARGDLRGWLIDARQRGQLEMPDVLLVARDMAGTDGMPLLRDLCWELDATRCDSMLSDWLREVLTSAGMTPDPGEHRVVAPTGQSVHLDVPFIAEQVAGEAEGFGAHAKRRQLNVDSRRRNTLRRIPWEIIWVTWDMLQETPHEVIGEFRVALEEARAGTVVGQT